jgi:hypothetical protein
MIFIKPEIVHLSTQQECSVFLFEKRVADKLHKPKRRETVTELLKASVKQLERFRHPKVSLKFSFNFAETLMDTKIIVILFLLARSYK